MDHTFFMRRALQLAQNGLGTTYPNPMVGSVIVHDGKIIGEGWHRKAGGPHAEVVAIASVQNPELLRESTIYVTLEPCAHFGKTPPCADLIIEKNIPKVVVATVDPNEKVAGKGTAKLRAAGIEVIENVLETECCDLNRRFFTFHNNRRPYIILKWAQTRDGFIAPERRENRQPVWITGALSRQLVHKWRTEEQAILVGTQTVIDDNPTLNARDWSGQNPTRIVIDNTGRISKESHIFERQAKTILLTGSASNVEGIPSEPIDFTANVPQQIAETLYRNGIQSVIVEGGAKTLQSFIKAGLWDEARVFVGTTTFGVGVKAPVLSGKEIDCQRIGTDELIHYRP